MNGRVLFDFMYDQFVWPQHSEREPKAADDRLGARKSGAAGLAVSPSRSVIVLADRRRQEKT